MSRCECTASCGGVCVCVHNILCAFMYACVSYGMCMRVGLCSICVHAMLRDENHACIKLFIIIKNNSVVHSRSHKMQCVVTAY